MIRENRSNSAQTAIPRLTRIWMIRIARKSGCFGELFSSPFLRCRCTSTVSGILIGSSELRSRRLLQLSRAILPGSILFS